MRATPKARCRVQGIVVNKQMPQVFSSHQRLDARSLAMYRIIAKKLLADPRLIDRARRTLARWMARSASPVPACFLEWQHILEGSPEVIAGFLASMSEDATRLRQSSPFTKVLTIAERSKVYAAFR